MKTKAILNQKLRARFQRKPFHTLHSIGVAAVLAGAVGSVTGCSSERGNRPSYQGEFVVSVGTSPDGREIVVYSLRNPGEPELVLDFAEPPTITPGAQIRVTGTPVGDGAIRIDAVSPVETTPNGIATAKQAVTVANGVTTRRVAVLMLESSGSTSVTQEVLKSHIFDASNSSAAYYNENSFGKLRLTGDVFGWLHIASPSCDDTDLIATQAQQAAAAANIDLSQYDHVVHYMGNCGLVAGGFSGYANVGTPAAPARNSWYHDAIGSALYAHELGHNLGHWHANGYSCGTAVLAPPASCTSINYGDPYDVMSMGDAYGHFAAYSKAAQNWFQNCNVVMTPKTDAYTLAPIESSSTGVQAVRVPLNSTYCPDGVGPCYYYLETRRPTGLFDGSSTYTGTPMFDGVLVHINGSVDLSGKSGVQASQALDFVPSTSIGDGLGNGKTFIDPTGIRLKVLSQTSAATRIAIKIPGGTGAATCLNGSTYTGNALCGNGAMNSGETAIDCGGPNCAPCDDGRACVVANDCWSGGCQGGVCVPICTNGFKDGTETDVDCGGSCSACRDSKMCKVANDCISGTCNSGVCRSLLVGTATTNSDWQTGFCGAIDLQNTASSATRTWTVQAFFKDSTFTSTSGAVFTALGGGAYRLTPSSYNSVIYPSSHSTISFCATKTGPNYAPAIDWITPKY